MSAYFIPVFFLVILVFSLIKKVKPYDAFTDGAKSAVPFAISIFPYLVSIFALTELFEASGLSDFFSQLLSPVFRILGIPSAWTAILPDAPASFTVAAKRFFISPPSTLREQKQKNF